MPFKDPAAARESQKAYRKANKEALAAYNKAYRKANKEALAAHKKVWAATCMKDRRVRFAAYAKAAAEALTPAYVATTLKIPVSTLTPELLALKREQLETHRLARQVKQHLKDTKK